MGIVIVPYGQRIDTSLGEVLYDEKGLRFLEMDIVSREELSMVTRRLMMGRGQKVEVHYFPIYKDYENPVALLVIDGLIGKG